VIGRGADLTATAAVRAIVQRVHARPSARQQIAGTGALTGTARACSAAMTAEPTVAGIAAQVEARGPTTLVALRATADALAANHRSAADPIRGVDAHDGSLVGVTTARTQRCGKTKPEQRIAERTQLHSIAINKRHL
jgi:hypothetical protein